MESKVILITGVSSGFGLITAKHLASIGHKVYGSVRRQIDEIQGVGLVNMDVTDLNSVREAISYVISREGRIDVLINNAGIGIAGSIEETSAEELDLQMKTNFTGTVFTTQAVIPFMRQQKSGTIINISSIGGLMGLPFQGFYSASKFAVEGYSQALSLEVKPFKIRVVLVNPGDFATQFTTNRKIIAAGSSSHYPFFKNALSEIEKHEIAGLNPTVLAHKIACIVSSQNPAFRYVVASPSQKLSVWLYKLMPYKMFAKILEHYYKIR